MIYFLFYIVTRLDVFLSFSKFFGAVMGLITALVTLAYYISVCAEDEDAVKAVKPFKNSLTKIAIVFISLSILVPTSKQAAFIIIGPRIVQNGAVKDTIKNIPELTKLGTQYLKELLEEHVKEK